MIKCNQLQLITITNYDDPMSANQHQTLPVADISMYDTGVKVLSMKINYLAPFKHKHKHQKLAHEN
jgi:hypothetical protein